MAGRGKGALRIAIEDFLESFKWGKTFSGWFGEFGEDQEAAIGEFYDPLIQELPDGVIKDLVLGWSKRKPGDKDAQGAIASALGFAGSVGVGAASGLLAPWMKLINYRIERSAQTARIDPAALIQLSWRDPNYLIRSSTMVETWDMTKIIMPRSKKLYARF